MPNAFERRMEVTKEKMRTRQKLYQEERMFKTLTQRNVLIRDFEDAFFALYNRKVKVTFNSGWYGVNSAHMKQDELTFRTRMMQAKLHEQELQGNDNGLD